MMDIRILEWVVRLPSFLYIRTEEVPSEIVLDQGFIQRVTCVVEVVAEEISLDRAVASL